MKKTKTIIVLGVVFLGLAVGVYQYIKEFQTEFTNAEYTTSKPANGHSWAEMECSAGVCITASNKVGIGTDNPTEKLQVAGNFKASGNIIADGNVSASGDITASGDICAAGACLSQMAIFVANQPLVNNVHNQGSCTVAGGEIVPTAGSYPQCRFNAAACPTGWTLYLGWSTTGPGSCYSSYAGGYVYDSALGHAWSDNIIQETGRIPVMNCGRDGCYDMGCNATAPRTQVGCY